MDKDTKKLVKIGIVCILIYIAIFLVIFMFDLFSGLEAFWEAVVSGFHELLKIDNP